MATFITRVELHGITQNDSEKYEILHEAMQNEGFSRLIKGDSGNVYHLPNAEYDKSGNFTRDEILASAERAAKKTGKDYGILVTQSDGLTWKGLKKAT